MFGCSPNSFNRTLSTRPGVESSYEYDLWPQFNRWTWDNNLEYFVFSTARQISDFLCCSKYIFIYIFCRERNGRFGGVQRWHELILSENRKFDQTLSSNLAMSECSKQFLRELCSMDRELYVLTSFVTRFQKMVSNFTSLDVNWNFDKNLQIQWTVSDTTRTRNNEA